MIPHGAKPEDEGAFLEQVVAERRVVIRLRVDHLYGTALDIDGYDVWCPCRSQPLVEHCDQHGHLVAPQTPPTPRTVPFHRFRSPPPHPRPIVSGGWEDRNITSEKGEPP